MTSNIQDAWPDGKHTVFPTVLRFFWFGDDGGFEREKYVGGTYHAYRDGSYVWDEHGYCDGSWIDG